MSNKFKTRMGPLFSINDTVHVDGVKCLIKYVEPFHDEYGHDYLCEPFDKTVQLPCQPEVGAAGWVYERDLDEVKASNHKRKVLEAAAPDMLKALELSQRWLIFLLDAWSLDTDQRDKINAVIEQQQKLINKAKGGAE